MDRGGDGLAATAEAAGLAAYRGVSAADKGLGGAAVRGSVRFAAVSEGLDAVARLHEPPGWPAGGLWGGRLLRGTGVAVGATGLGRPAGGPWLGLAGGAGTPGPGGGWGGWLGWWIGRERPGVRNGLDGGWASGGGVGCWEPGMRGAGGGFRCGLGVEARRAAVVRPLRGRAFFSLDTPGAPAAALGAEVGDPGLMAGTPPGSGAGGFGRGFAGRRGFDRAADAGPLAGGAGLLGWMVLQRCRGRLLGWRLRGVRAEEAVHEGGRRRSGGDGGCGGSPVIHA